MRNSEDNLRSWIGLLIGFLLGMIFIIGFISNKAQKNSERVKSAPHVPAHTSPAQE